MIPDTSESKMDIRFKTVRAVVGDTIKCKLFFLNRSENRSQQVQVVTAQLQCWQFTSKEYSSKNETRLMQCVQKTRIGCQNIYGSNAEMIEACNPKILLSDIVFQAGAQGFTYFEDYIPNSWVPSYNGRSMQFKTKLMIDVYMTNKEIHQFTLSVKVKPFNVCQSIAYDEANSGAALRRTNPFLAGATYEGRWPRKPKPSPLLMRVSDPHGEICKLRLLNQNEVVGETMIGTLDFIENEGCCCCQYSVSLIAIEKISNVEVDRVVHCVFSQVCLGIETSSFEIQIPENVVATFTSEIFSLHWILRFEFVLADSLSPQAPKQDNWRAPRTMEVRTRKWETELVLVAKGT